MARTQIQYDLPLKDVAMVVFLAEYVEANPTVIDNKNDVFYHLVSNAEEMKKYITVYNRTVESATKAYSIGRNPQNGQFMPLNVLPPQGVSPEEHQLKREKDWLDFREIVESEELGKLKKDGSREEPRTYECKLFPLYASDFKRSNILNAAAIKIIMRLTIDEPTPAPTA